MKVLFLPTSVFFLTLTFFSGFLAVSSTSWVFVFAGLVLNTVAVLPNLIQLSLFGWKSGEAAGKYFLVQAKASALYAAGSAVYWHWDMVGAEWAGSMHLSWGLILLMTSFFVKLGLFPFYAWVPGVTLGVSWFNCWLVLTWQKFFPLLLLLQVLCASSGGSAMEGCIMAGISFTALSGGLLGLGQTNLRSLVAYSSLVQSSWGLMASTLGVQTVSLYMMVYSAVLGSAVYLFSSVGVRSAQDPLLLGSLGASSFLSGPLVISILSLGGMPPLTGFFGKWLVMSQWGALSLSALPLAVSLAASFMSLSYYLSICWGSFWRASSDFSLLGSRLIEASGVWCMLINTLPGVFGVFLMGSLL